MIELDQCKDIGIGSEYEHVVNCLTGLGLTDDDDTSQYESQWIDDERDRKLFVGGLSWLTTEDGLQRYFETMNMPVDRVIIMRDKVTGRSRGFGFVILRDAELVDKAVIAHLYLDGRRIEAKRAIPKQDMDNTAKKIFVGGIPLNLTNSEFRRYFETFGIVLETQVMTDRDTGRSRGFGFVTFEDEQITQQVLKRKHQILGKPVEVKRAEPKKADFQTPFHMVHPVTMPGLYLTPFSYPTNTMYPSSSMYSQMAAYDPAYFISTSSGGLACAPPLLPVDQFYDSQSNTWRSSLTNAIIRRSSGSSDLSEKGTKDWNLIYPNSPNGNFSHVRIQPSEVRTERALSASVVPLDLSDPFNLAEDLRKRRGMSQPEAKRIKHPSSLVIGSRRMDLNWRTSDPVNLSGSGGLKNSPIVPPKSTISNPSDYLLNGINLFNRETNKQFSF